MTIAHDPASSTVLTCGQLRLTIPASARTPSFNLRPGSTAVDVSFLNFSGTVTFDLGHESTKNTSPNSDPSQISPPNSQPVPFLLSQDLDRSQSQQKVEPHQQIQYHPQTNLELNVQGLQQQPTHAAQPLSQSFPQPVHITPAPPRHGVPSTLEQSLTASLLNPLPLSQHSLPLPSSSAPLSSLPKSMTDQFLATQSPDGIYDDFSSQIPSSQSFDAASQYAPSQLHALPMPDSQFPDSSSQATQNPDSVEIPPLPQFVPASLLTQLPSSSPSSVKSGDERAKSDKKKIASPNKLKLKKKSSPKKHPSALARVEARKPKHGKRVRFDENPVVVTTPPRKKHASTSLSPPRDRIPLCSQSKKLGENLNGEKSQHEHVRSPALTTLAPPTKLVLEPDGCSKLTSTLSKPSIGMKTPIKCVLKSDAPLNHLSQKETKCDDTKNEELKVPKVVASPGQPSPWQVLDNSAGVCPRPRWGATFTPLDENSVLLVGGESDACGFFDDTVIYDVSQQSWISNEKRPPPMPFARAWHSATLVDRVVFVFGGEVGDEIGSSGSKRSEDDRVQSNNALVYDSTYRTWYTPSLTGTPPMARAGHCAALIPGSKDVLVFGGTNKSRWLNDFFVLEDLCNWIKPRVTSKMAKPSQRSYATLTTVKDYVVLFGGNNKRRCLNDVFLFDGKSRSWIQPVILGQTPKARTGHCAVALKDGRGILIYGGWDDQGAERLFYSDVWMLRIESKTECQWTCVYKGDNTTRKPGPRAGASMCSGVGEQRDQTLLFGGWYQVAHFSDIVRLDVSQNGRVRCHGTQ